MSKFSTHNEMFAKGFQHAVYHGLNAMELQAHQDYAKRQFNALLDAKSEDYARTYVQLLSKP